MTSTTLASKSVNAFNILWYAGNVLVSTMAHMLFGWTNIAHTGDTQADGKVATKPKFLSDPGMLAVMRKAFKDGEEEKFNQLSDDALVKICRQLEFFYKDGNLSNDDMASLARSLVDQSLWHRPLMNHEANVDPEVLACKVPRVRFGKTELDISVVTCGGMRLQYSWFMDNVPLLSPNRDRVLKSIPQENVKNCIKSCLALGINHFETARMYGTSEFQMVEALYELIQEGEIKREDFILQTKLVPGREAAFRKSWDASWANISKKLGYIDLLALHTALDIDDAFKESLDICLELKREGKVKHIGFSTHGTSEKIMNLINTEKFDYINLHEHYFGSYHGSGTPNTVVGGQGNQACINRALELDMGVFQISPVDKGGKLFRPSKDCVMAVGKELTPISFALLHAWNNIGVHTSSVGVARQSDLDEVLGAAKIMALAKQGKVDLDALLNGAKGRLDALAEKKLGKEWLEKGLINLPSQYDQESDGIAIGHILWLYNLITAYGMYEFCWDRYISLLDTNAKWDKKKSFDENAAAMSVGNPGRCYDESVDLTKALEKYYDPALALERIKEMHELFSTEEPLSDKELEAKGWKKGYNLSVWTEMPGEIDSRALSKIIIQTFTGGRMGVTKTGPGNYIKTQSALIREMLS